jgi:hypothetical protein
LSDWRFAQEDPADQLCALHHFAMKHDGVEFVITVREFINPPDPCMKFLAEADKQTNQRTAPYTPTGWGPSLMSALAECMRAVKRFSVEAQTDG